MTLNKGFKTFLILSLAVFSVETAIMLVLGDFDSGSLLLNAAFDSLLLTVVIAPLIYVLVANRIQSLLKEQDSIRNMGKKNSLMLNSLGEGIYGVDLDGNIIFLNRQGEKILGYSLEELSGRHSHEIFHYARPDGAAYASADCKIYAASRDGLVRRVSDEVFWKKGGEAVPVEYIATPIMSGGKPAGAVVAFSDITERLRAAKELQAAKEAAEAANKAKANSWPL